MHCHLTKGYTAMCTYSGIQEYPICSASSQRAQMARSSVSKQNKGLLSNKKLNASTQPNLGKNNVRPFCMGWNL